MQKKEQFHHNRALVRAGVTRFGLGILILGAFLFLCAGTLRYWNAWLYLIALAVMIFSFGVYLYARDQELLQKRLTPRKRSRSSGRTSC